MTLARTFSLVSRGGKNYALNRPFCVSFEVTKRCNARCHHCHLHGIKDDKVASAQEFGDISRRLNPVVAQVSGGEPLLRKDVEEIIRAIRRPEKAPVIVLTTNGVLLTRDKLYRLMEAGVDSISLSLDYPDERHDDFRQVKGLFARISNLMKELDGQASNVITVSCVLQSDNFRDAPDIARLANDWGICANFSTYTWLRTKNKDYMISEQQLPEFKETIEKLIQYKNKTNNIRTSEYVFQKMIEYFEKGEMDHCRAGERFLVVNPDGSLSPCGLIITEYQTLKEVQDEFCPTNTCGLCYTSIRANTEKPLSVLVKDNLQSRT
jgi:MoaA/NifB/PqqE/SkfB family radical SAM enzyme